MSSNYSIRLIRHGQSFANIGENRYDSPLTAKGIEQASNLYGHYDYAVLSPMRRAQETALYSNITYTNSEVSNLCREIISSESDCLLFEQFVPESNHIFAQRVEEFKQHLYNLAKIYKRIVVFTHGHLIKILTNSHGYVNNCDSIDIYIL